MPRTDKLKKIAEVLSVPLEAFELPVYVAGLHISIQVPLHSLEESVLKVMEIKDAIRAIDDATVETSVVSIREVEFKWPS